MSVLMLIKTSANQESSSDDFATSLGITGLGVAGGYSAYKAGANQARLSSLKKLKGHHQKIIELLKEKFPNEFNDEKANNLKEIVDKKIGETRSFRNKYALGALGAVGGMVGLKYLTNNKKKDADTAYKSMSNNAVGAGVLGLGAAGTSALALYNAVKGNYTKANGYILATLPVAAASGILVSRAGDVAHNNRDKILKDLTNFPKNSPSKLE